MAQGYDVDDNILYQDNQSAMLLEKHGRASSSKRTRHINIRYYFVADRVSKKEVRLEYCPTGEMIADYFTKPLQGSAFRRMRDAILNIPSEDGPASMQQLDHRSVLEDMAPHDSGNDQDFPVTGQEVIRDKGQTWANVVQGKGT